MKNALTTSLTDLSNTAFLLYMAFVSNFYLKLIKYVAKNAIKAKLIQLNTFERALKYLPLSTCEAPKCVQESVQTCFSYNVNNSKVMN